MNCYHCNKKTNNPKFCSRKCSIKNPTPRIGKEWTCKECLTKFRTSAKHRCKNKCRICVKSIKERSNNRTLKDIRDKSKYYKQHRSSLHSAVRAHCRTNNKSIITKCQVCDYSVHVELCHIKDIVSFADSATIAEVNHPDNILVLCRNHHWEFDNEYLLLENIPERILDPW